MTKNAAECLCIIFIGNSLTNAAKCAIILHVRNEHMFALRKGNTMKKDVIHSIISRYGVVTLAKNAPWLTLADVPQYQRDGFTVRVKCVMCGNVHNLGVKCQVCGKTS